MEDACNPREFADLLKHVFIQLGVFSYYATLDEAQGRFDLMFGYFHQEEVVDEVHLKRLDGDVHPLVSPL